jgi:selenocysteine-specific elongation factor
VYVLATAGHVDHGKSALVRALTGMEPDRLTEERRRGVTIDLGFAWTVLPSGATVAFVDVPGHEKFVPNMLAGVGPVPAALLVVAADEAWKPQSAEHLAALHAFDVRHGLLVVTRSDLADPATAAAQACDRIAATSLGAVPAVAVSAVTGAGLDELRAALDMLVTELPAPRLDAPVRLWVDRCFTVRGSGTVVTGTLGAGILRTGDTLHLTGRPVRVRSLQTFGAPATEVAAVARVAVNLRGVDRDAVHRGDALVTPDAYGLVDVIDVRMHGGPVTDLPAGLTLHIGSAAVGVAVRPLGPDSARLRLSRALPLRIGDRALLRDPGLRHIAGGITVLDVAPPPLRRRGAAAARAAHLSALDGRPDVHAELRRRGLVRGADLRRWGVTVDSAAVAGDWHADPTYWATMRGRLADQVDQYARAHPLESGMPVEVLRRVLDLPDRALVEDLVSAPLTTRFGRVTVATAPEAHLPAPVAAAVERIRADLATRPFAAPEAARLTELGLGARQLAAAHRVGALLRIAEGVVLLPDAPERAVEVLAGLPQPFALSEARRALDTSRRVAVPLLELLDRRGDTRRLPDDRRTVTAHGDAPP